MMKNLKNLFVVFALCAPLTAAAQDIEINAENFPDENFRNYLLRQSYGKDSVITGAEIKGVTHLYVDRQGISSLKGIEHFTALEYVVCNNNPLTSLDMSSNTALTELDCNFNQLTALDVSGCTALKYLFCYGNQLTALDVNNTALTMLWCYRNQIKGESMDALVSGLPKTGIEVGVMNGGAYVYYEGASDEGNVMTKSQVAAAKNKGWQLSYYNSTEKNVMGYEGMDETTSIAQPELENGTAAVYTLQGQKVSTPVKGSIYIVDGKKVVVR